MSDDLDDIFKQSNLKWVISTRPCCIVLAMCLKHLMSKLIMDALIDCKKKRHPHLFQGKDSNNLDLDEERSEVIGFYGWAIFSFLKRFQKEGVANEHAQKLLGVTCSFD